MSGKVTSHRQADQLCVGCFQGPLSPDEFTRQEPLFSDEFTRKIEKVVGIALLAFAAYTNLQIFFTSAAAGIALGYYQEHHNKGILPTGNCGASCAQILSGLFRVNLPDPISTLIAAAFMAAHIEHHPEIGILTTGLYGGYYAFYLLRETFPVYLAATNK